MLISILKLGNWRNVIRPWCQSLYPADFWTRLIHSPATVNVWEHWWFIVSHTEIGLRRPTDEHQKTHVLLGSLCFVLGKPGGYSSMASTTYFEAHCPTLHCSMRCHYRWRWQLMQIYRMLSAWRSVERPSVTWGGEWPIHVSKPRS